MDDEGEAEQFDGTADREARSALRELTDQVNKWPVVTVPISSLVVADSPRLGGEDMAYVRVLAESDAVLPPIVVHGPTMRVIDGKHRLCAAILSGRQEIEVRFFNGDEANAFVVAVHENVTHGLPLSLADRKAAAERIIVSHPHWSNGIIAGVTGLAANTVRRIRRCPTRQLAELDTRMGRDGKTRPINNAQGRARAYAEIVDNPTASLREIARAAKISPETARDVRKRLHEGQDPVPGKCRGADPERGEPPSCELPGALSRRPADRVKDPRLILDELRSDPSIRFNEIGRAILRLLDVQVRTTDEWNQLIEKVPPHCRGKLADFARGWARRWESIADGLTKRQRRPE